MLTTTKRWCWSAAALLVFVVALPAQAQRTVTLTLNSASTADTIRTDSFMEVRGAVKGVSPVTLFDGNVIDWNDTSTLEPVNIGGDYWQVEFQIADTTDLTFKFYSQQVQDVLGDGWEADPNPNISPGTGDTTLAVHFFESAREFCYEGQTPTECLSGDRGPYDWRPYESKEDTIAVWYRVAMFGSEATGDGYDRNNATHRASVTGLNLYTGHPFDWGTTWQDLNRESNDVNSPGYDIFSGVVYYPASLAGTQQPYKFVLVNDGGIVDWENRPAGDPNRTFVVPAQDTTLQWVYYGDTPPSQTEPVTGDVIFTVDLSPLEQVGLFDKSRGDTLQVQGDFNGWDWGDRVDPKGVLDPIPGQLLFERVEQLTLVPKQVNYKFILWFDSTEFHNDLGFAPPGRIQNEGTADAYFAPLVFEEPLSTAGGNRSFAFTGASELELPVKRFNDVLDGNIVPAGTSIDVTWSVDMTPALTPQTGTSNFGDPFVPGVDKVMLKANADLIWAVTQGYPRRANGTLYDADTTFTFAQANGNVWEGTKTITGPTYAAFQYLFSYGTSQASKFDEQEGAQDAGGRRRTRFIRPNPDGSWPATYAFPPETFLADGDKPAETNPAIGVGVEPVDGELPLEMSLSQNFPNPFNPTTTFEYAISQPQNVELFVYDILGRRVRTLVNGLQPANTYKVSFDASTLASGTYFYRLETADKVITRSMVLLK